MAERSWYVAVGGSQKGPYPEAQFRSLIVSGHVTPDTFVWADGMAEWQRAGDIPGLMPGAPPPPTLPLPLPGAPPRLGATPGGALEATFGVWPYFGRTLLFGLLFLLVIPAPWAAASYWRWMLRHIQVPQRGALSLAGDPIKIWYIFIGSALCSYAGAAQVRYLPWIAILLNFVLMWMMLRWLLANIACDGEKLPTGFSGQALPYVGWNLFLEVSFISIIGWAWVEAAWLRWIFRHVEGTRRAVTFTGTGWEILWRSVVFGLTAIFIVPIPWTMHWIARWFISQVALVPRTA